MTEQSPSEAVPGSRPQRLFFALWPDDGQRVAITRSTRNFVKASGGKPVPQGNFHITLVFLGTVAPEILPAIRQVASDIDACGFDLTLLGIGFWPRPRVLWLAPDSVPGLLTELVGKLWTGLTGCGFERDNQAYRPHMTLARKVRSPGRVGPATPVGWPIREFVLVESVTTPHHATYRVIESWPLA